MVTDLAPVVICREGKRPKGRDDGPRACGIAPQLAPGHQTCDVTAKFVPTRPCRAWLELQGE